MTISSENRVAGPYIGNDAATAFPFAFKVFGASDLQVVLTDSDGAESTLTLTTDYTVTLNSNQDSNPGGTVTLPAVLATGYKLTVTSSIIPLQATDLTNQGGFYPKVITNALDKLTILIQQLLNGLGRSIKLPISDSAMNVTLPAASVRASKALGFDANGQPIAVPAGSAVTDSGAVTFTTSASYSAGTVGKWLKDLASSIGASLVGFIQAGVGAVARTMQDKQREIVSVLDFGADPTGVSDSRAAIVAAIARIVALGGGWILFPSGTYKLSAAGTYGHIELSNLDNVFFLGFGAKLVSDLQDDSRNIFDIDGCRNITIDGLDVSGTFARSLSTVTTQGVGFIKLRSNTRDSNSITVRNVRASNVYGFAFCSLDNVSYRVRGISIDNCLAVDGYYGINFQNNGDLLSVRNFRTYRFVRTYFPYGVTNHDVQYESRDGDVFTDCLIKAYAYDTTDIRVKATIIGNTSNDSHVTIESQHTVAGQPTPAKVKNVQLDIDDTQSSGTGPSVRFAYWRDGADTATSAVNLFDNITLRGIARKHIQFAVAQATDSGRISLGEFSYDEGASGSPYANGFYQVFGKGVVGNSEAPLKVAGASPSRFLGGAFFMDYNGSTYGYVDGSSGLGSFNFEGLYPMQFRRNGTAGAGSLIASFISNNGVVPGVQFYDGGNSGAANAANSVVKVGQMNATGRSVSVAGTVNTSGADYAEYERNNGLSIAKGAIVGFKADGTLTLTFAEAVRFGIKSTDPSFVGGDTWANAEVVGNPPDRPARRVDEFEETQDAHGRTVKVLIEAGDTDDEWAEKWAAYQAAEAEFQAKIEAERVKYDRIAYAGKVPCNVMGATPGGYIVAAADEDGLIVGRFVQDPDFAQYKRAVGRVNRILDDGRCEIAVIVH